MIRYLLFSCLWMVLYCGAAAQLPATPATDYKDIARQRLLLFATCKFIYVSSQGQMDEDSAMLFACHMYGLSRLLPYNGGYSDGTPSAGSRLIDNGKIRAATAL